MLSYTKYYVVYGINEIKSYTKYCVVYGINQIKSYTGYWIYTNTVNIKLECNAKIAGHCNYHRNRESGIYFA